MSSVILDIEANGLVQDVDQVWCAVGIDADTGETSYFTPENIDSLPDYLDGYDVWIGHNVLGYDAPVLKKVMGYDYSGSVYDTLVASRLLCPRRKKHGLAAWGDLFGVPKVEHEDWDCYSEAMLHRCDQDAKINQKVYEELGKLGRSHAWRNPVRTTMAFFKLMAMQEEHGWLMDQDLMNRSISLLTHWMDRIEKIVVPSLPKVQDKVNKLQWHSEPFKRCGGYKASTARWLIENGYSPEERPLVGPFSPVNIRNMDLGKRNEVVEYLLESGWKPIAWNVDKDGKRSSPKFNASDPLRGITNKAALLISKYIQCRHRRSQIEGWFKRLGPDGRLRQSIVGIANTGRLKHSGIVNVPSADAFFGNTMRKCFIAKPGYVIVGTDAAGCQNRALASRVNNHEFTQTLVHGNKAKGTSIHQVNQKAIKSVAGFDVSYGEAKALNYAFLFGASNNKLGSMISKNKDAGAMIRKALLGVAPGFKEHLDQLNQEWMGSAKQGKNRWGSPGYHDGTIRGIDGRPIIVESPHMTLNYELQSDEAILMQLASLFLYKACVEKGWVFGVDYAFVAHIHDEYSAEVREDICVEYAKISEEAITRAGEYLEMTCPQSGESSIGDNWAEVH